MSENLEGKIENTKTAMVDVPITNLSFSKSLLFINTQQNTQNL